MLTGLHFNEVSDTKQAVTKSGESQYRIEYPKYKDGAYIVKKVKEKATFCKHFISKIYFSQSSKMNSFQYKLDNLFIILL